jgi:rhodanese-related sulfurtransferase
MKAFDSSIATTGLTLSAAKQAGFDAASVITIQSDRAHFLPTQSAIPLMIIFDKTSRQVLGVQGFGSMNDAVLARIDAAAGLISRKAKIEDFSNLEMAYAPPFSTAIDALNSTANVADNLSRGRFRPLAVEEFVTWMENPDSNPDWICLDTRAETDAQIYLDTFGDRWMCVPYPEIRRRYHELPKDKTIIIICGAGTRSYEVQVFLDSVSYTNSLVLGGGLMLLRRLGLDWVPDQAVS